MKIAKTAVIGLLIIAVLGTTLGILAPLVIDIALKENSTGWIAIPAPPGYEGDSPCFVWNGGGVWCH